MHRVYYDLLNDLRGVLPDQPGLTNNLPYVAGLLAHVRTNTNEPLGRAMQKPVSDLRFRRLLQNESRDELFVPMIRVIHMLKYSVNVLDLTASVFFWGDSVRKNLAARYYTGEEYELKPTQGENQ